jgi:hypothetical protein
MLLFHQGCHSELVDRVVELQDDSKLLEELVTSLFIYLALPTKAGSPQQHMPITVGPFT